jgi:hypothetical protein
MGVLCWISTLPKVCTTRCLRIGATLPYEVSNGRTVVNDELERIWKEAAVRIYGTIPIFYEKQRT